jgi:hypothetical protein
MSNARRDKTELAATANGEEIDRFLHDPSPGVIRELLGNRNLTEEHILIIAKRMNLPADLLAAIAKDKRWSESYLVRLALARNPRTPLSVSLSIARYLHLFDLEELTRSPVLPLLIRHKVEGIIIERISIMPLGNKKTLAKKAAGKVLLKLLQDPDPEVVQLCLMNPYLTEAQLFKVINHVAGVTAETIRLIATHPKWSNRSRILFSLTRNALTPLPLSVRFLETLKLMDLRELYADPAVPVTIKPFVHSELLARGEEPGKVYEEQVYEINEEEMAEFEADTLLFGEIADEHEEKRNEGDL